MTETARPIPLAALGDNLRRLCWIRWIILLMQCSALAYAAVFAGIELRYTVLFTAITVYVAVNAATLWRLTGRRQTRTPVTEKAFFLHLLFDVGILSLLLYLTGGSTNPFISFFLVPISISAATLAASYTWTVTGLTAALYFLMLHFYIPVAWFSMDHTGHGGFNAHILGMWFNFVFSAALITYFVVRMAAALREHDRALSKAQEDMLRNEQVIAVATLAAGTAHRLGTPLSTMAILLDELKAGHAAGPLHDDLVLLKEQVDRCKDTLRGLIDAAERKNVPNRRRSPVIDYFNRVVDDWRILHPDTDITVQTLASGDAQIEHEETLDQAIMHLLDNAVETGSETIELTLTNDRHDIVFRVRDHGPGVPADKTLAPGKPFVTTKKKGFGLGLFLSHATISRYQGQIALRNHEEGGAVAELRLPLAADIQP